jgi:hypothetical protein
MATLDRPAVEYRTPADLVRDVERGALRVPPFQRGFRWEPSDVAKLFDSLYRGYPIGNLLLWRHSAPAQHLTIGPIEIDAEETDSALWVVDGQQRITSIVGALMAADRTADSRFRIYLDLDDGSFRSAGARQEPPLSWVPVSLLYNTVTLIRWMRTTADALSESQITMADQAAKAIREYQIPTYIVRSNDEEALIEIFTRMNNTGKPLSRAESFTALHSGIAGSQPTNLRSIGLIPAEFGFGHLDDRLVLRCLLAYRGGDIFRDDFHGEFSSDADRISTFGEVGTMLREVVRLLQGEVGIPHIKLLPYSHVIPVLVRFLRIQGAPNERVSALLRRWIWRSAVAGTRARGISVVDIRRQVQAAEGESAIDAARVLLTLTSSSREFVVDLRKIHLNHAMSKLNVLGLLSAGPIDIRTGQPIDIRLLLDGGTPLQVIVEDARGPYGNSTANRIISFPAGSGVLRRALASSTRQVAASHLIDEFSQHLLSDGDDDNFLIGRSVAVQDVIAAHIDRMAEWGARDGRAITDIIRSVA